MKKRLFLVQILLFPVLLVVFFLIGAYLLRNSIIEPKLEQALSKQLERTVDIEGFVLHVFRARIHMDSLSVSSEENPKTLLMRSGPVEMQFSRLPLLLTKTITIQSLDITELEFPVLRDTDANTFPDEIRRLQDLVRSIDTNKILQPYLDKIQSTQQSEQLRSEAQQLLLDVQVEQQELQDVLSPVLAEVKALSKIQVRSLAAAQDAVRRSEQTYTQVENLHTRSLALQQKIQTQGSRLIQASGDFAPLIEEDVNRILQDIGNPTRLAREVTIPLLEQLLAMPITRYYKALHLLLESLRPRDAAKTSRQGSFAPTSLFASLVTDAEKVPVENVLVEEVLVEEVLVENVFIEEIPPPSFLDDPLRTDPSSIDRASSIDREIFTTESPLSPLVPDTTAADPPKTSVTEREEGYQLTEDTPEIQQTTEETRAVIARDKKAFTVLVHELSLSLAVPSEPLFVLRTQATNNKTPAGPVLSRVLRIDDRVLLKGSATFSSNPALPILKTSLDFSGLLGEIREGDRAEIKQYTGEIQGTLQLLIQNPQEGRVQLLLSNSETRKGSTEAPLGLRDLQDSSQSSQDPQSLQDPQDSQDPQASDETPELSGIDFETNITFQDGRISRFYTDPRFLDSLHTLLETLIEAERTAPYEELHTKLSQELLSLATATQNELDLRIQEQYGQLTGQIDSLVELQNLTSDSTSSFQKDLQVYRSERAQEEAKRIQETFEKKFKNFGSRFRLSQ